MRREVLAQIPHCLGMHRAGFPAKIPVHSAGATQSYGFKCRLICLPGQIAISFWTCFAIAYKESESEAAQSCLTLCDPMDCSLPGRQEDWSGLPLPSSRDLPDPGIKPRSPTLQVDALLSEPPGKPRGWRASCCKASRRPRSGPRMWCSQAQACSCGTRHGLSFPGSSVSKEKVRVKVAQSCLTLCDPMEFSRPED